MLHSVEKLPKWTQALLVEKDRQIRVLEGLRKAHAVLDERDWFTIRGPRFDDEHDLRHLWYLSRDGAHPACSLGPNDILLVGRALPAAPPRPRVSDALKGRT